jgi:hypothetical protein
MGEAGAFEAVSALTGTDRMVMPMLAAISSPEAP